MQGEGSSSQSLLDKVFHHLFRHRIVGDNTLAQRSHRHNIAGRSSQHQPRILSNRLDLVCISVKCTPEEIAEAEQSYTGIYIRKMLEKARHTNILAVPKSIPMSVHCIL